MSNFAKKNLHICRMIGWKKKFLIFVHIFISLSFPPSAQHTYDLIMTFTLRIGSKLLASLFKFLCEYTYTTIWLSILFAYTYSNENAFFSSSSTYVHTRSAQSKQTRLLFSFFLENHLLNKITFEHINKILNCQLVRKNKR